MSERLRRFGTRLEGWTYQPRPSAYVVVLDGPGRLLVVRGRGRISLPGGRIESGESALEAARREAREETGYRLEALDRLGEALQWSVNRRGDAGYEKHCAFFRGIATALPPDPAEPGHEPAWLDPDAALAELHYESHVWVVRRALARLPRA